MAAARGGRLRVVLVVVWGEERWEEGPGNWEEGTDGGWRNDGGCGWGSVVSRVERQERGTNEDDGGARLAGLGEEESLYGRFALCEARRRRAVVLLRRVVEEVRYGEASSRNRGEGVVRR